jgi:hypothetical protein
MIRFNLVMGGGGVDFEYQNSYKTFIGRQPRNVKTKQKGDII